MWIGTSGKVRCCRKEGWREAGGVLVHTQTASVAELSSELGQAQERQNNGIRSVQ